MTWFICCRCGEGDTKSSLIVDGPVMGTMVMVMVMMISMTMIKMMISKMIKILVKTIISGFTCRQREGDKKKDKIQLKELRAEDKFSIKYDFFIQNCCRSFK